MESNKLENFLKKLEDISKSLEKPDLPLDIAMEYYEEGLKIIKECNEIIKNAESKLTILTEEKNNLKIEKSENPELD